jgi:Replication initiator protein, pSAM2
MTAATVTTAPGPDQGPGAPARGDFDRWERQLAEPDVCSHPIRLHGQIKAIDLATGELATVYDTAAEPSGVLRVACGNRRESVCPACSQVYKRDARQLVRAGLVGGKGVPDSIAAHPCVFATFTAPSFGPVHSRRMRGKTVLPCRPRRDAKTRRCPHGRDISCPIRHGEDDPRLGRAMCGDCYGYQAAVLFNAYAGDLWRRFTTYLPRHLARLAGVTGKDFRAQVRIRYIKVAEYQARGVVHFHAVIRLDAATEEHRPPSARYTADLLCDAIGQAAAAVRISADIGAGRPVVLRFGKQIDCRPVWREVIVATGKPLDVEAVANYIAKYVTKSLDVPGLPHARLRSVFEIQAARCPAHYQRMMTAAWQLGARQVTGEPRFRKWAHTLGYGGHPLTKSRRYSVTFGHLRGERAQHRRAQRWPDGERDPWGRPLDDRVVLILKTWTYAGTDHTTATPAAELALASADMARGR